jgi:hypothetical protein
MTMPSESVAFGVKTCPILTRNDVYKAYRGLLEVCRQLMEHFESESILRNQSA